MKTSSLKLATAAFAALCAAFTLSSAAQAPAPAPHPAGGPPPRAFHFPPPKNLQVLPKDYTAEQVHETMEKWAGALGTHCDHCHAADPDHMGPNGRPRLNFAADTKKEKKVARLMYKMVQEINTNYVSMVDNSGTPVTCGTCHRGHVSPEPYVAPEEHHGPPPPAGAKPPAPPTIK